MTRQLKALAGGDAWPTAPRAVSALKMSVARCRRFRAGKAITTRALTAAAALALAITLAPFAGYAGGDEADMTYEAASQGTRLLETADGVRLKMLVEQANLGGLEIEIGELFLPVSYGEGPAHPHGALEIIYVLSGELGHRVNGELHVLTPGMVGIVRTGDEVTHSVRSDEPVRGLVIWAPAGEAEALISAGVFTAKPIE